MFLSQNKETVNASIPTLNYPAWLLVILIIENNVSFGISGHKKATNGYGKWQISICVLMNQDKCKWYQLRRSNWRTVVFYFIRQAYECETKCMKHVGLLSNYQICTCAFSAHCLKFVHERPWKQMNETVKMTDVRRKLWFNITLWFKTYIRKTEMGLSFELWIAL